MALLLLRVPGFAGGTDYGAAAGHASGGAGVAEDGAQDAADDGTAGGAFGGVAAGADFVGDGAAVGEVLLVLGFVDALLVHHHALGRGAGGGEQGGEGAALGIVPEAGHRAVGSGGIWRDSAARSGWVRRGASRIINIAR